MAAKDRQRAVKAARLFKLVASSTRASIMLALMKHKEMPVQDIAKELGMTHSAVSHQLGLLADADIVSYKKAGRLMCYTLAKNEQAKALTRFLGSV